MGVWWKVWRGKLCERRWCKTWVWVHVRIHVHVWRQEVSKVRWGRMWQVRLVGLVRLVRLGVGCWMLGAWRACTMYGMGLGRLHIIPLGRDWRLRFGRVEWVIFRT